jgi:hypothetical protein
MGLGSEEVSKIYLLFSIIEPTYYLENISLTWMCVCVLSLPTTDRIFQEDRDHAWIMTFHNSALPAELLDEH